MENRRRGKLAELKDLWHEFLHPPSSEKLALVGGRSIWQEDKREDQFVELVFSAYEKVLPFICIVDPIKYYKDVQAGDSNPRSGQASFPLRFNDENGNKKAITWGKSTLLKPTFEEYFQAVSSIKPSYERSAEYYFETRNWDGRYTKCMKL